MEEDNPKLKLLGKSAEDLKTISAYLQDSIVTTNDIIFLKQNKIFIMIVNRFMWEDAERGMFRKNKRIRSAIKFNQVYKVISKNINQKKKDKILEFLAIETFSMKDNSFKIRLIFAGDSVITVFVEEIDVLLDDIGESWNVKKAPRHKI